MSKAAGLHKQPRPLHGIKSQLQHKPHHANLLTVAHKLIRSAMLLGLVTSCSAILAMLSWRQQAG
jgi:hypothetical protein